MKYIILLLIILSSNLSWSHEEHPSDTFNLELSLEIFRKVIELSPELSEPEGPMVPFIQSGGRKIYLNSGFWTLVRGWVDLYHHEVKRDCENCVQFDEEELLQEAKDMAGKGFFNSKLISPMSKASEHIITETADIGARLGNVALVAKITSEVAETVLSKTVGGGGVHVLCTVIDAVILFGTRHLQIATRIPSWSYKLGAGSLGVPIKYWLVSRSIRRAQKRVQLYAGPIELNEDELEILDGEGPQKKSWFGPIKNKRSEWIKLFDRKSKPLYRELSKIEEQLSRDPENKRLKRRKENLQHKISKLTRLKRKDFLGSRYKRFFFLKARHGKKELYGTNPIEKALGKQLFWIVNLQQNILNRGLVDALPQDQEQSLVQSFQSTIHREPSQDEILLGLSREFAGALPEEGRQEREQLIQTLLSDIEFIFDGKNPARERYLYTLTIEQTLTQLAYKFIQWQADTVDIGEGGWIRRTARASNFRWKSGQYVKHVFEFTDFLRIASVTSSEKFKQKNKYEAMESLIRIFNHLEKLNQIFKEYITITEMLSPIREANSNLFAYKPWKEKKSSYSWIPFRRTYPQCADMWEGGQ